MRWPHHFLERPISSASQRLFTCPGPRSRLDFFCLFCDFLILQVSLSYVLLKAQLVLRLCPSLEVGIGVTQAEYVSGWIVYCLSAQAPHPPPCPHLWAVCAFPCHMVLLRGQLHVPSPTISLSKKPPPPPPTPLAFRQADLSPCSVHPCPALQHL